MPAFTEDYFPNVQMAWEHFHQPAVSVRVTTRMAHTTVAASSFGGSSGSGNAPPNAPFTAGNTPPSSYKNEKVVLEPRAHSVAGSPERHHGRRSNASLTSALAASLSRGLSHSSGSLKKRSSSPAINTTTSGTLTPGGVTWGVTTFLGPSDNPTMTSAIQSESDGGEDDTPKAKTGGIRLKMKNQDRFDREGCGATPLLNERVAARVRGYRQVYANLLAVWGLETARLEMLKFNGVVEESSDGRSSHSEYDSSPPSLGMKRANSNNHYRNNENMTGIWKGLGVRPFCGRCGTRNLRFENNWDETLYCAFCAREQQNTECYICGEMLVGVHGPCLNCGHATHAECLKIWLEEKAEYGRGKDGYDEAEQCPTGCGCPCSIHTGSSAFGLSHYQLD